MSPLLNLSHSQPMSSGGHRTELLASNLGFSGWSGGTAQCLSYNQGYVPRPMSALSQATEGIRVSAFNLIFVPQFLHDVLVAEAAAQLVLDDMRYNEVEEHAQMFPEDDKYPTKLAPLHISRRKAANGDCCSR